MLDTELFYPAGVGGEGGGGVLRKENEMRRPWPVRLEHHAHMEMRQKQHERRGATPAERWMQGKLVALGLGKWRRQAQWGFRLFDFWHARLGMAVEVDGHEHDASADRLRDAVDYERSGIVVIRVRNWNEQDAKDAEALIRATEPWNERRLRVGLKPLKSGLVG